MTKTSKQKKKKKAPASKKKQQEQKITIKEQEALELPNEQSMESQQCCSLVALIQVTDVSRFLSAVSTVAAAVDGGHPRGRGPALALYMAFRHRLSPAHYRPELTSAQRSELIAGFLDRAFAFLRDTIEQCSQSVPAAAMWLANTSELHHLLTKDRDIGPIMRDRFGKRQKVPLNEQLAEVSLAAFGHLVALLREQLCPVIGQLFDDGITDEAAIVGCRKVLIACRQQLSSANVAEHLTHQVFCRLYGFISAHLFNRLLMPPAAGANLCTSAVGGRLQRRLELLLADEDAVGGWPALCRTALAHIFEAAQALQAFSTAEQLQAWASDGGGQLLSPPQLQTLARRFRADDGGQPTGSFALALCFTIFGNRLCSMRLLLLPEDGGDWLQPFRLSPHDGDYVTGKRRTGCSEDEGRFFNELQSKGVCRLMPLSTAAAADGKWTVHFGGERHSPGALCAFDDDDKSEKKDNDEFPKMKKSATNGERSDDKDRRKSLKTAEIEIDRDQKEDALKKQHLKEEIDALNKQLTQAKDAEQKEKLLLDRLQKENTELRVKLPRFDAFAEEKRRALLKSKGAALRDRLRNGAERLCAIEDELNAAIHRMTVAETSFLTLKCHAEVMELERRRVMAVEKRDQGRAIAQSLRAQGRKSLAEDWQRYQHDWHEIVGFITAVIDQVETDFSHQKERIVSGEVTLDQCAPVHIPPMPAGLSMPLMEEDGDEDEEIDENHQIPAYNGPTATAVTSSESDVKSLSAAAVPHPDTLLPPVVKPLLKEQWMQTEKEATAMSREQQFLSAGRQLYARIMRQPAVYSAICQHDPAILSDLFILFNP